MCGRISINCNNIILFNVNSHELIKELIVLTAYYIVFVAFRFIVEELCSISNSHEDWMDNFNFTQKTSKQGFSLLIK